ncbi:serine/threonine protein kinase [Melittangium boletus]|uniref:Protein kinase domain-containing protein n=1 Tax=Melittangium boletus DSM 14713 TaxID=1294270 RepID=A0A250I868_9BACT|nr:serine/threonine-protein kinase [Melittangium boletus]ATB27393.1 hypothetical protein MEBOL_000831 [Melittangium boletus DSM 14713]
MHDGRGEQDGEELWGPEFAPGRQVAGFTLRERLDTGGASRVYLAERGGRLFALKLVPMGQWGEREVDALRRVRDAAVVGLLGYGQWPETRPRFLVLELEWVEGVPLDVWAGRAPRHARQWVEQVLLPLTRALGQVHAAGVVHRDVKEANVVMRQHDGQPVLVDFGSAAYEGSPRLTKRLPPGTPEYRSPEMLRFAKEWEGEPYTSRPSDDWWALGVMLYILLTRSLPFGDRHGPLVRNILQHTPEPPHVKNPRVPQALGELCLRMLEKAPESRYADAPALVEAMEEALRGADDTWLVPLFDVEPEPEPMPVRAEPQAAPRRVPRKRWPWLLALGGAAAVLLLAPEAHRPSREEGPPPPRIRSPPPPPSQQAGFRQEIAPVTRTAEVGPGAELMKSPLPVPVAQATHREEKPMRKPHPGRTPVASTVVTAAACLSAACATAPRPLPPPANCPPGSEESAKRFGLRLYRPYLGVLAPRDSLIGTKNMYRITVRDGARSTLETLTEWAQLPDRSLFQGELYFARNGVHGRYTRLTLPSGESFPICATLWKPIETQPGSTSEKAIINPFTYLTVVPEFP